PLATSIPVPLPELAFPVMSAAGLIDSDLVTRRLSLRASDVVFAKSILEASEGVGVLFGERGGELIAAAPRSRCAELDRLLFDLCRELGAVVGIPGEDGAHET